jgi:hypothetical protein
MMFSEGNDISPHCLATRMRLWMDSIFPKWCVANSVAGEESSFARLEIAWVLKPLGL